MCTKMLFIKNKKQSPWNYKHNPKYDYVPCGKCPQCLQARANAWAFRLQQEEKISSSAHFITLTYATEHLPITKNGYGTIHKNDLQLFFKRLRKNRCKRTKFSESTIKYYAVGEYGGKLKRAHYHIILFNAAIRDIAASWTKGHIHYGSVSGASIGYTLKYISKPYKNFRLNDDREKPFSVMSKKLGISYIRESTITWHHADITNRCYAPLPGGKKGNLPRYYKERIYSEFQRQQIQKAARQRFAEDILRDILKYSRQELDVHQRNKREGKFSLQRKHDLETQKN